MTCNQCKDQYYKDIDNILELKIPKDDLNGELYKRSYFHFCSVECLRQFLNEYYGEE